jgi:hypothetical protein
MTQNHDSLNPYAYPEEQLRDERIRVPWISFGMSLAAMGLIWMAGSRFAAEALDSRGFMAGVLVASIGTVVGRIIGTQPRARGMTILASAVMFLGLVNGWVDHEGEERILWGFACMCGGLLLGTAYPAASEESSEDDRPRGTSAVVSGDGDERLS